MWNWMGILRTFAISRAIVRVKSISALLVSLGLLKMDYGITKQHKLFFVCSQNILVFCAVNKFLLTLLPLLSSLLYSSKADAIRCLSLLIFMARPDLYAAILCGLYTVNYSQYDNKRVRIYNIPWRKQRCHRGSSLSGCETIFQTLQ